MLSQNIGHTLTSQETCLICGDVASGKHYGLRSCEACKAFFKRTVQGKIEYSCPATRECEINKRRRKACQACRFQKCLNMGMLKEGVRLDRVRGGRQKYRRGLSPSSNNNNNNSTTNNNSNGITGLTCGSTNTNLSGGGFGGSCSAGLSLAGGAQFSGGAGASSQAALLSLSSSSNLGTEETNRIMTALINCEPEELTASPAQFAANIPSTLSVQVKTLYILSDLFDRELVSLIGWAKQIPGFTETITLNDQMRLLQSTWAEVIALSIGYRSHLKRLETYNRQQQQLHHHQRHHHQQQQLHGNCGNSSSSHFINATPSPTSSSPASTASGYNNHNNQIGADNMSTSSSNCNLDPSEFKLVFAKDLVLDFKHAVACGVEEIFYNCVQLIKRLDYLKITPNEYIILKAISLTNADVRLEDPKATYQLRDLILDTLYEATIADATNSSKDTSCNTNIQPVVHNNNNHQTIKIEAQERPLSSTPYASTSPPRPSSSIPSSSSLTSVSSQQHNNNNNNNNNNNSSNINVHLDTVTTSKKLIINHRLNQVMLCLPVLRQIDSCIRKFWNDVRKGPNNVPMNKLFEEMLEPCQKIYKSSMEM